MALSPIDQLCLKCGLCCDGTLFADVELRAGDDLVQLRKLGLPVVKKGARGFAFPQRCACFDGKYCHIYEQRPKRCRQFVCGLLWQVEAGNLKPTLAVRKIAAARRDIAVVDGLLTRMGHTDRSMALMVRYAAVMSAPLNLAEPEVNDSYGKLMLQMNRLMHRLYRDFLT